MPTVEKVAFVKDFAEKLAAASSLFVTDHTGLDAAHTLELRRLFREVDVEYSVVKNTLTKVAAEEAGVSALSEYLTGPTAIAIGHDDPVAPARVIAGFNKGDVNLKVRACFLEGRWFDGTHLKRLAALLTREQMAAQLATGLISPLIGLAGALQAVSRQLVTVLAAVRDQKESSA